MWVQPLVQEDPCPGEGNGNLFQYSCLGKPMDRGAWQAKSPWGSQKRQTQLSNWKQELHIVNKLLINLGTFLLIFCWVPTYNTYINSSLSHWYATLRISHFLSQNISCPSWNSTVFSSSFSHHFILSPWGTIPAFCDPTMLWIPLFLLCPAIAVLPTV